MLHRFFATRHQVLMAITAAYFLPLAILTLYGAFYMPSNLGWSVASLGLFSSAIGALCLFIIMHNWQIELVGTPHAALSAAENPIESKEEQMVFALLEESKSRCQELEALVAQGREEIFFFETELKEKKEELLTLTQEKEFLQGQQEQQLKEFDHFKSAAEEKLEQNLLFLNAHQQTIHEQRDSIESKQQQIAQLEGKVRDLTYEIKTLLQLAEKAESIAEQKWQPQLAETTCAFEASSTFGCEEGGGRINNEFEGLQQLRACIDSAQRITGTSHYGNRLARVRDLSIDSYALDLRHLSENFNSHHSSAILFYSAQESKPLFINHAIKQLLEWSAEKYIQNFPFIMQESEEKWKELLAQLNYKNEVQGELLMKAKSGKSMPLQCVLGVIPSGVFRGNFIAVFYPKT